MIHIYYPLDLIIDTNEFQRLRYIKQLSFCFLVFPSADYSRFIHSLGVYSLANMFVKELAETQPELNISSQDQLCVCIAALIHDIGHGPFSHFYNFFIDDVRPNNTFCHENYSKLIFRRMLNTNSRLKCALDEYLDERDYVFIEELINPPTPFLKNGVWQLLGRPITKSFLYEIVNNKYNGLDVDKFDYLLRDSLLCNVPIALSKTTISRICETTKVFFDKQMGYQRLMFGEKHIGEIRDVFEARVMLHDRIYQHKTVVAADISMLSILRAADERIPIFGDNGKSFNLSQAYENLDAFLAVDDRYLFMVKNSTSDALQLGREQLRQLERRELPKFVYSILLNNFENLLTTPDEIKCRIIKIFPCLKDSGILVTIHCVHRGMGVRKRPMDQIRVYDNRNCLPEHHPIGVCTTWYKYNTFPTGGKAAAKIYAPFETSKTHFSQIRQAAIILESQLSLQTDDENVESVYNDGDDFSEGSHPIKKS